MDNGAKIVLVFAGFGIFRYFANKPRIKVLKTDATNKAVQYQMSANGKTISDTFYLGDQPNIIALGDSDKLYSLAKGNTTTGIVDLVIGYYAPNGAFQGVKGYTLSFDTPEIGLRMLDAKSVTQVELPDGEYKGRWGGYTVDVLDTNCSFKTDIGVRNIHLPVMVYVRDKTAMVTIQRSYGEQ